MNKNPTISVLGAGYVGLTTAALLACCDYKVYLVEIDKNRLDVIKKGRSFFFENGLDQLIDHGIKNKQLIPSNSYKQSIPKSDIVFSCVGTPDNPDGSFDMSQVLSAANEAATYLNDNSIFVQKSTVPIGTGCQIEKIFTKAKNKTQYVSCPEFLREGYSIHDTLCFDRVVAGGKSQSSIKRVFEVYKQIEKYRAKIINITNITAPDSNGIYIETNLESAELIKVASNAFLATKISFANTIAKISDKFGADVIEIMDAVGADKRIGRSFLNAGRGYGGGCLPKDVSGLISSGTKVGLDLNLIKAAQAVNDSMPGYIIEKLQEEIGGNLHRKKIAVLGMAFKSGIDDTRKSPGITIANLLASTGASVSVYDPIVKRESVGNIHKSVSWMNTLEESVKKTEAVIISTDWSEFTETSPEAYSKLINGKKIFVDATNSFSKNEIARAGLIYIGVGR